MYVWSIHNMFYEEMEKMCIHNICMAYPQHIFYGEMEKIIPGLSPNTPP